MEIKNKEQVVTYVIFAVLIVFVLSQLSNFLETIGLVENKDDKKTATDMQETRIADTTVAIKKATEKGEKPSYTKQSYRNFADNIWYSLKDFMRDRENAWKQFQNLKTNLDVDYLISAFGVRSLDGKSYDLKAFINERMERTFSLDKSINDINESLEKKKIKYRF